MKQKKLTKQYIEYIKSDTWKAKRHQALKYYGHKCYYCDRIKNLHVHHLCYDRFGCEDMKDLRVVCEVCHEEIHRRKDNGLKPLKRRKRLRKKSTTKQWDNANMAVRIRRAEEFERRRYARTHAN